MRENLQQLATKIRACSLCAEKLPNGPRPVLQVSSNARILIAGQAPGSKVHASGVPFDDASGDRLRDWMGVSKNEFYDADLVAILPMGFCYPGTGPSGDLPPIPLCAETWRNRLLTSLPNIQLTLVIGLYAQRWHLEKPGKNLTSTVRDWHQHGASVMPLPHPSPRNNIWLNKNPWFVDEVLPVLKDRISHARLKPTHSRNNLKGQ